MPVHKKTFKKIKKFVKKTVGKIDPLKKLREALKPKGKTAVRGATKAPSRTGRRAKTPRRSVRRRPRR